MDEIDPNAGFSLTSPLPYVLITSIDSEGRPNVMGASWVTKLSFEPFLMAVSVGHKRYSHGLIKNSGEFVICYPSAEQEKQAMYCGFHSGTMRGQVRPDRLDRGSQQEGEAADHRWMHRGLRVQSSSVARGRGPHPVRR